MSQHIGPIRSIDQPQPSRRRNLVVVREIDLELGAMTGKDVLGIQHRFAPWAIREPPGPEQRRPDRNLQHLSISFVGRDGPNGLAGTTKVDVQQLDERRLFNIGP